VTSRLVTDIIDDDVTIFAAIAEQGLVVGSSHAE